MVQAARKPGPIEGELLRVDTGEKTITVRETNGAVVKFQYTKHTEVTGAGKNMAGLATNTGEKITVYYEIDKQSDGRALAFAATRIDVHAAGPGALSPEP